MQRVLVFADPEVPAALQVGFVLHFQLDCAAQLVQEELWGHGRVLYFMLASMLLSLRAQPPLSHLLLGKTFSLLLPSS